MANMTLEKRRNPRFTCSKPRDYPIDFIGRFEAACLFDFSREGLAIQSPRRLEQDGVYKFEIWAPALENPISCEARILWARSQISAKHYTCGASILRIDPSSKIDLLDVLYRDWKQRVIGQS